MQTEAPIRHHSRKPSNFSILLANVGRSFTSHDVEVNDATKNIVLKILLAIFDVNLDIHARAGEKEDTMGACLTAVLKVDRVRSIEVRPCRYAVGVAVPERADVVGGVQAEAVCVLSETVEIGMFGERSTQAKVLILEDERCGGGVEEDFFVRFASHLEAERALLQGKVEV